MSQRIKDALDVLRLIRDSFQKDNSSKVEHLRTEAINTVAERGVDIKTVFAHLVGKNVPSKLSVKELDIRLTDWLKLNSTDLKNWYLLDADSRDKERIESFFNQPGTLDTPKAVDIDEPDKTTRVETTIYRVLRDTVLSREVKMQYKYRCQLCGSTLPLGDGSLYAEAHHVKPLGKPYNGPDVKENIICVCPTCHVLLDYKSMKLDPLLVPNVFPEYIEFHKKEIYGKTK
jgi:hypothetical protein